jgi:hypothetical protein
MSIIGSIVSSIFHHAGVPTAQAAPAAPGSSAPGSSASTSSASASSPGLPPKPGTPVDVDAVLSKLAAANKENLDWKKSIVDLLKLLNLDSSLAARKELAKELHYSGDPNDSAAMNVWLHKQVVQKIAQNGGKVPADLLHA